VDNTSGDCEATGSCTSCATFNQADVDHIKAQGWNTIRLSIVWAGAQTEPGNELNADFLRRLHAILDMTDKAGLHVFLDNHGDMVGSANCGNGLPMWISQAAAPDLIGKPLTTELPYSLFMDVKDTNGYSTCGDDAAKWGEYAGDPNYNLLNQCCIAMNAGGNQPNLAFSKLGQYAMNYIQKQGAGREAFVKYMRLVAESVVDHPSVFAIEPMNEPMSIKRGDMFDTWKEIALAVNSVIPDMAVAVCDIGEGGIIPDWLTKIDNVDISHSDIVWMQGQTTLFYAWHWYGNPKSTSDAIKNVQAISKDWNMPSLLTEFMSCDIWHAAEDAGIGFNYWHYSAYCNTGPNFGNKKVPDETFGACILGWGGGNPSKTCPRTSISLRGSTTDGLTESERKHESEKNVLQMIPQVPKVPYLDHLRNDLLEKNK